MLTYLFGLHQASPLTGLALGVRPSWAAAGVASLRGAGCRPVNPERLSAAGTAPRPAAPGGSPAPEYAPSAARRRCPPLHAAPAAASPPPGRRRSGWRCRARRAGTGGGSRRRSAARGVRPVPRCHVCALRVVSLPVGRAVRRSFGAGFAGGPAHAGAERGAMAALSGGFLSEARDLGDSPARRKAAEILGFQWQQCGRVGAADAPPIRMNSGDRWRRHSHDQHIQRGSAKAASSSLPVSRVLICAGPSSERKSRNSAI